MLREARWRYADSIRTVPNAKHVIVALPGLGGSHRVFFRLQLRLAARGVRLIAADYPPCSSHTDFVDHFTDLLDHLKLSEPVVVLGTMLGGYLAQCVAEQCPDRVSALILTSTYCSTTFFQSRAMYGGFGEIHAPTIRNDDSLTAF